MSVELPLPISLLVQLIKVFLKRTRRFRKYGCGCVILSLILSAVLVLMTIVQLYFYVVSNRLTVIESHESNFYVAGCSDDDSREYLADLVSCSAII